MSSSSGLFHSDEDEENAFLKDLHNGEGGYDSFPAENYQQDTTPQGVCSQIAHWLKLPITLTEEEERKRREKHPWFYCHWRRQLGAIMESRYVQYLVISLLVLDIVLLIAELAFEEHFAKEEKEHWLEVAEHIMEYMALAILFLFAFEILLLIVAFDISFFLHPFYLIDAIIIGGSLFIELYLKQSVGGFLVLFRLWRIIRVVHGIVAAEEERHNEAKHKVKELQRVVQEKDVIIAQLHRDYDQLQQTVAHLKRTIRETTRRSQEVNAE